MQREISNFSILKKGIDAANSGQRETAREILREYVEMCPGEALGWLWLGSVVESKQDSISAWRKVIEIDPENRQARAGLGKLLLHEGVTAAKAKEREKAREILLEASEFDGSNEVVWLWLATVSSERGEASRYALRALEINPDSERARNWLEKLRQVPRVPVNGLVEKDMGMTTLEKAELKCPYCDSQTEDYKCVECGAVLTLQSADALLGEVERKTDLIREAVQGILAKRSEESDNFDSVFNVALGYLNCRDVDRGALFLAEAGRIQSDDKQLNQQIDTFLRSIGQAPVEVEPCREEYHHCNILLVDDSATLRKLISAGLATAGHEVRCAIHGRDALNQMAEFSPDLVISDINMPHLDGYALCREIRSNPATSELPVIMLSARDGMFDRELGTSAGATDFIAKPFEIASLLNLVEHYSPASRKMEVAG